MADNVELDAGSGGATLATDDVGGVHYQIGKVAFGALDSATLASSGAGNVDAGTQRVTLAADDPAVVDLAAIEIATEAIQAAVEGTLTVGSHAVTNAGTFAVQESGTHVQVDDAAFTPATSKIVMVGAEFDDTTPDSVDEGDGGAIRMSANRNLYVTLRDAAGNERGLNVDANGAIAITDGSGSITVDNAGLTELAAAINASSQMDVNIAASNATVTVSGTVTANLSATDNQVLDNIDADTSAIQTATEAIQAAVEAAGGLVVNLGANNDVTVTGTVDLGATDNGVLDAIAASLALLDNAIATGNELQVDVVAALPAGDNNIGNVDAIQSGTWTVDLGATDNAVLDAIAASVAAIDTDATTIIGHVDGIEGLLTTIDTDTGNIATSLATLDNIVLAEDAAHQTGDPGVQVLAVRQSSQSDFGADGDYVPLSIDDDGGLRVSIVAGAGSGGTAAADDADFTAGTTQGTPSMGVYESSPTSVTDGDLGVVGITQTRALRTEVENTVTVSGTVTANLSATDNGVLDNIDADLTTIIGHVDGIEGLLTTIDSDTGGILTAVQLIDNAISGNEMQVDVVGALPAGTNNIGDVDIASALPAGTNSIGNVGLVPRTSGGMTIFRSIDIDESEEEVKATAGQVFSITAFNRTAAPLYLKFYNATAANVTVGTTTPVLTFVVPGNADSDGAGFVWNNTIGFAFSTAISVACTTGVADNDTGAPGANDCIVIVGYA